MKERNTIGLGASSCWHITHGTPILSESAMLAHQLIYASPAAPYGPIIFPYSFSIYTHQHTHIYIIAKITPLSIYI